MSPADEEELVLALHDGLRFARCDPEARGSNVKGMCLGSQARQGVSKHSKQLQVQLQFPSIFSPKLQTMALVALSSVWAFSSVITVHSNREN
ncbi:hypothetical protein ABZP36_022684 [Zizania latifolia]